MLLLKAAHHILKRTIGIAVSLAIVWTLVYSVRVVVALIWGLVSGKLQGQQVVEFLMDAVTVLPTALLCGGLVGILVGAVGKKPMANSIPLDLWGTVGAVLGGFTGGWLAFGYDFAFLQHIELSFNPIATGIISGTLIGGIAFATVGECVRLRFVQTDPVQERHEDFVDAKA